ncbi:MAG: hypothetical protein Tsb0019_11460 [Roseibium sp.]
MLRLSNVYGAGQSSATFLGSVLRDLATTGKTVIGESADSAKDYICVDDVVTLAERIARSGGQRIYNVASGRPVSHGAIAQAAADAGYSCTFRPGGARRRFPAINITRITDEFAFAPRRLLDDLPALLRTA